MVFTGAFVYLQWAPETTFGTAAANIATTAGNDFGFEQKITSWSFTNNKIPLSQLNDVRVKTYAYGQTRGSLSLDFVLSDPFFVELIGFKAGTKTGCASPYTYTWLLDTTLGTKTIPSFTTQVGMCAGACNGIVRTMAGGIVNTANISVSIGELARVTLDTNYANETLTTTLDACLNPMCVGDFIPMTFAHATLAADFDGCGIVTIAEVQDLDITFSQNSDHLWGIGNSVASSAFKKLFEITGKFKASYTCTAALARVYSQQNDTLANSCPAQTIGLVLPETACVSMTIVFTNGLATTAERSITFSFTGVALDDHNLNIEPNEPIFEELNFQATSCTVVAVNATAAKPAAS